MKDRRSRLTQTTGLFSSTFFTFTFIALVSGILLPSPSAYRATATTDIGRRGSQTTRGISVPRVVRGGLQQAQLNNPHVLPASYYSVQGNLDATLTLNNKGPEQLHVHPTLFSMNGQRLDLPAVTVAGTSFRVIDLREWAVAGDGFAEGSLQIRHYGMDLQLGAQVKIIDKEHSLIFDEQLMQMMSMSSRLEGVWWLRSHKCNLRLVLSNTTDSALAATVTIYGIVPRQSEPFTINLAAHETRVINVRNLASNGNGNLREIGGLSISYGADPGALVARGFIDEASTGFSSSIEFWDPLMAHSSKLAGGGLRLRAQGKELMPVVVARNIGTTESIIRGIMPYSADDGTTSVIHIPEIRLGPGEIDSIDVSRGIRRSGINTQRIVSAGLEFEYSSPPGSIVMAGQSLSFDGNQVFRLPFIDADAEPSSTGGYPWSIDGSSSTVVYITNVTERPHKYVLQLNFQNGVFAPGLKTVQPYQTEVIDIRKLRDEQMNDEHGRTIPLDKTSGQVHWSVTGPENLVLIGRAEQADLIKGTATSYACVNCCPDNFDFGFTVPESVAGFPGDTTQFFCMQQNRDCYGTSLEPFFVFPNWSVLNPNIASIDGNGLGTALNPGSTFINAAWVGDFWELVELEAGHRCDYDALNVFANAFCDVLAVKFLEARLVDSN